MTLLTLTVLACGSSTGDPVPDEIADVDSGAPGVGGQVKATGGSTGSGGKATTGGSTGSGGKATTGGSTGSGGKTGSGGTTGSGGAIVTDGGTGLCGTGSWQVANIPAVGTAGVVYVSDLTPTKTDISGTGSGPVGMDKSFTGKALVINNVCYPKGIGVHANTRLTFALGGAYKQLLATTGLDWLENSASMIFEVTVDGTLVYDKGQDTLTKDQVAPVSLDVTGKNTLELFVRDAFDDVSDDFGVWGGVRLLK